MDAPLSTPADVFTIAQNDTYRQPFDRAQVDVSADGRFVAFTSYAQLVPADANDTCDVYVLDRATGSVTLERARCMDGAERRTRGRCDGAHCRVLVAASDERHRPAQRFRLVIVTR